ncbi:MAG TPA: aromatic ring-hydroxylating dioxygenase subunit alpha [Acidimicrobiales bacterium]|nr:aromatic ring-hydroxylating dioxygenase subunit alpha [Acidimicrobiales bacterium]
MAEGARVERDAALRLMRRAVDVGVHEFPEIAPDTLAVPLDYFTDPAWFARERAIFEQSPIALIASSEIAGPHDFLVRSAVGRSLLITRDDDGRAHVFLNYCRHRAAQPASGCGNAKRFTCPYHAWVYDSTGALVGMPLRDRNDCIPFDEYGLVELPSEERHGFVWAVLERDRPIDVAAHLGALDAEIGELGCERMRYYPSHEEARIEANWKICTEGVLEGLHVPYVHAKTFNLNPQAANVDLAYYDAFEPFHVRYGMGLFDHAQAARLDQAPQSTWQPDEAIGNVWILSPGMLLANELYGVLYATLTPGEHLGVSYFRYGWLSPVAEPPAGMPTPAELADRARRAVLEDIVVWEGCARGMAYGQHEHELIGRNERGVQLFHEGLARQTGYAGLRYGKDL